MARFVFPGAGKLMNGDAVVLGLYIRNTPPQADIFGGLGQGYFVLECPINLI